MNTKNFVQEKTATKKANLRCEPRKSDSGMFLITSPISSLPFLHKLLPCLLGLHTFSSSTGKALNTPVHSYVYCPFQLLLYFSTLIKRHPDMSSFSVLVSQSLSPFNSFLLQPFLQFNYYFLTLFPLGSSLLVLHASNSLLTFTLPLRLPSGTTPIPSSALFSTFSRVPYECALLLWKITILCPGPYLTRTS